MLHLGIGILCLYSIVLIPPWVNIHFLLWLCAYQPFYLIHFFLELMTNGFFHFLDEAKVVNILDKILLTTLFQITFPCVANGHKCSNIMLQFDELSFKKRIYDIIFPFKKQYHLLANFHKKNCLQLCHPFKSTLIRLHFDNTFYVIMTTIHWCLPKSFWLFGRFTRFKDFDMYGCN